MGLGQRGRDVIVVDSSAVVAILFGETGAEPLVKRLARAPRAERWMSVGNYVEAATVLAGRRDDPAGAVVDLDAFVEGAGLTLVAVDEAQARLAVDARVRFGKGFRSPAKLNYGDCFAYALAKTKGAPLLFVGADFADTDLASAMA